MSNATLQRMAAHGWIIFLAILGIAWAGRHHNQQSSIEKLLAAGLIAKALAKGGEEGGGDGGHHYMPVHVPIHHHGHVHGRDAGSSAAASHHHHVHHKYVPIPVKHHTNFIIAHHKVPVPIVKTKVVHVPVQQTRIVPIIVHKDQPPHRPDYHTLASEDRKVRVTSLGTLRSNGTAPLQFQRPTGSPDKWIVVVKSKRRRPHGRKS